MGGVCSAGTSNRDARLVGRTTGLSEKLKSLRSYSAKESSCFSCPHPYTDSDDYDKKWQNYDEDEQRFPFASELKPRATKTGVSKITPKNSLLGRAGIVGLERAVDVLDTLGSSVSNLNAANGFVSGTASRGSKLTILAFEVANTIAKGANLLQSLSGENVRFLKREILHSEGIRNLVSSDSKGLLSIAAADKREEWDVFSREVVRFGNLCKDPQWHNLGRYFSKLDSDYSDDKQLRVEAEMKFQELATLVKHTSELYHELHALDRFEQDYRRKLEEMETLNLSRRGESIMILQSELKQQRKLVGSLKKKSLWSRNLEEIMDKLVDIVAYVHQTIMESFGINGVTLVNPEPSNSLERLGAAGLALHYANIVNQIDNIACRPNSVPPNMRDTLYHRLPTIVKTGLRSRLQSLDPKKEFSVSEVKAEMEKILRWLVPLATNTTKAHQGFGWVGEWANTGGTGMSGGVTHLQTLYHADKKKIDNYILDLVTWLHLLITSVRQRDHGFRPLPVQSPTRKGLYLHSKMLRSLSRNYHTKETKIELSQEERNLLDKVSETRLIPGTSKSHEFPLMKNRGKTIWGLSRSAGNSPSREFGSDQMLEHSKRSLLDVIDGLDFSI